MGIQLWIHDLDELLQGGKLLLHSTLVSQEVRFLLISFVANATKLQTDHHLHDSNQSPERVGFVCVKDVVNWREEI